jgi:hypothetical protein
VHGEPTADLDLDVVRTNGKYVFAWSDGGGIDPRVVTATVGDDGNVATPAKPITPPFGPQALIRLVQPIETEGRAYIAWENLVERPAYGRAIRVAPINGSGEIAASTAVIDFAASDGGVPELAATVRGLGAITLAPECRKGAECSEAHVVPTFTELDENMEPVVSEPIRLKPLEGRVADLAWGLHCDRLRCRALAAEPTSPAPVFAVQLSGLSSGWKPAVRRYEPPPPPRVVTIESVAATESVFDMSAARVGDRTLVSWVTYFDPETPWEKPKAPAPDGRYAPVRALLSIVSLGAGRQEEPEIVSYRARSRGGCSLAAATDASKVALLGWSALEQQIPQVFVTPPSSRMTPDGSSSRKRRGASCGSRRLLRQSVAWWQI